MVVPILAAVLVFVGGCTTQQTGPTGQLANDLDARVERAMEGTFPMCPIGDPVIVESYCYTVCAAKAFGVEPKGAHTIEDVKEVFASSYCRTFDSEHIDSSVIQPVALRLTADPPQLLIASDTQPSDKYRAQFNQIFPPDVRRTAQQVEQSGYSDLVARVNEKARTLPTPTST